VAQLLPIVVSPAKLTVARRVATMRAFTSSKCDRCFRLIFRLDMSNFQANNKFMIGRQDDLMRLSELTQRFPVVGIVGARQVGKTTLAAAFAERWEGDRHHFDLENPTDLTRLSEPLLALENLRGLVVIDEIQAHPDLFPVLRVLADRPGRPTQFLVLGSAAPHLLRQGAESLAGRIFFMELTGLTLRDVDPSELNRLWLRGGFPLSYLAESDAASMEWRQAFLRAFLERDLPQLGITVPPTTMRRFWTMLAHMNGQVWNASALARSFGVSDNTVRRYLDHLEGAMVVRQLQPWHENLRKRQVKSPKVYFRDTGLLHALLNLPSFDDLAGNPGMGASWEGLLLQETGRLLGIRWDEGYFWATHAGAELDLLVVRGRRRLGFEFKRTASPKVTRSSRTAIADLGLERLEIVFGGSGVFPLDEKVRAIGARELVSTLEPLD